MARPKLAPGHPVFSGFTNKLIFEGRTMSNHLTDETSPYLLQHAENPVDWYPWGKEALDRAKTRRPPSSDKYRLFCLLLVPCYGA